MSPSRPPLIISDVASYNNVTQAYLDEIARVNTTYTELFHKYYPISNPLWDES